MAVALLVLVSAAFGVGDQYLGSFSMHPWMADVSLLSAPWLALPFIAGATQRSRRRAALWGLIGTYAALTGYALMTFSPAENAHLTLVGLAGYARSSWPVLVGGLVTGPLFGVLGHRWRAGGARWPALLTAGALCLEPLARVLADRPIHSPSVLRAEVAAGVLAAAGCAYAQRRHWLARS